MLLLLQGCETKNPTEAKEVLDVTYIPNNSDRAIMVVTISHDGCLFIVANRNGYGGGISVLHHPILNQ